MSPKSKVPDSQQKEGSKPKKSKEQKLMGGIVLKDVKFPEWMKGPIKSTWSSTPEPEDLECIVLKPPKSYKEPVTEEEKLHCEIESAYWLQHEYERLIAIEGKLANPVYKLLRHHYQMKFLKLVEEASNKK